MHARYLWVDFPIVEERLAKEPAQLQQRDLQKPWVAEMRYVSQTLEREFWRHVGIYDLRQNETTIHFHLRSGNDLFAIFATRVTIMPRDAANIITGSAPIGRTTLDASNSDFPYSSFQSLVLLVRRQLRKSTPLARVGRVLRATDITLFSLILSTKTA